MKKTWLIALLALWPLRSQAGVSPLALPSLSLPKAVTLPSLPVGPAVPASLPSQRQLPVALPSQPLPLLVPGVKLPGYSVAPVAVVFANGQPAEPQAPANGDKLGKVYDGSGAKKAPAPVQRPRGNRRYYTLPESDLLDEIGIR